MIIAIYLVILVAAFYFLIVRPQRRRSMIQRQLLASVGVGDRIMTSGGIQAVVVSLGEDTVEVAIAPGVEVTLARGAIVAKLDDDAAGPTGEPGTDGEDDGSTP